MTTETLPSTVERPRRLRLNWVLPVLFKPRQAFASLHALRASTWLTPILILSLTTIGHAVISGYLKQQIALTAGPALPPNFEYYSPEQQAQFLKAAEATQGPVFNYVLPALGGFIGVWIGWLLVGGMLHLVLTLLGGRGDTNMAMNVVAWGSLPFALRDLVRIAAMLSSRTLLQSAGVSGFVTPGDGGWPLYLAEFLSLVDIYLIWHILLTIIGVRAGTALPTRKAALGVIFTILFVVAAQALLGFAAASASNITVVRPFFF